MSGRARVAIAAALLGAAILGGAAATVAEPLGRVEIGAPAPDFTARGADGRDHRLSDYAGKVVVLEWTSPVCPYTALKYQAGLMQALQRQAARQGVTWLSIDTAAPGRAGYLTPDAAKARVAAVGAAVTAFLFDPDGRIGRAYGARTTPSVYVIAKNGRLAYQGAIDDDPGRKRPGANFVSEALDDLQAGRAIATPETHPYGCAVEY